MDEAQLQVLDDEWAALKREAAEIAPQILPLLGCGDLKEADAMLGKAIRRRATSRMERLQDEVRFFIGWRWFEEEAPKLISRLECLNEDDPFKVADRLRRAAEQAEAKRRRVAPALRELYGVWGSVLDRLPLKRV